MKGGQQTGPDHQRCRGQKCTPHRSYRSALVSAGYSVREHRCPDCNGQTCSRHSNPRRREPVAPAAYSATEGPEIGHSNPLTAVPRIAGLDDIARVARIATTANWRIAL